VAAGRDIRVERDERGVAVVVLTGEQDSYTAERLRDELEGVLEPPGVVVDLSGATFVDSSTVGALLGAQARVRARKLRFEVVLPADASEHVWRLLRTTGLHEVFSLHETRVDALRAAAR
jgi:anti-sigma B factor antagonist